MAGDYLIPIIFWGTILLLGSFLYSKYRKKHKTRNFFQFKGWRKIIYYLGWLNVLNFVFWIVIAIYYRRYKHLSRKEKYKKLAYVVYFFGYLSLIIIVYSVFINFAYY